MLKRGRHYFDFTPNTLAGALTFSAAVLEPASTERLVQVDEVL
jgi:hypothetical protein